jgi:hypothetical protein
MDSDENSLMDSYTDSQHDSPLRTRTCIETRRTDDAVLTDPIVVPPGVAITRYSVLAEHLNQSKMLGKSFAAAFRKSPF